MPAPHIAREQIQGLVRQHASAFGVPYHLALAVLETESNYFPFAESEKGAKGLMQLMPLLLDHYRVEDPFDPDQNIKAGIQHIGVLLNRYDGDQERAVAAYFAGEPAVNRAQALDELGPETQAYVPRVLGRMAQLKETAPGVPPDSSGAARQYMWIYPTAELASDSMVDDDGGIMDEGDPRRQGIQISFHPSEGHLWEGEWKAGPSAQEMDQIFLAVDPEGMITREDAATIAAMGTSLAPTGWQAARRAVTRDAAKRAALRLGARAIPGLGLGLTAATGLAGAAGDIYRQFQIPDEVSGYAIESWPRSNILGIPYEGAPKTLGDAAHSAAIAGLTEGMGELAGSGLANLVGRFGRWWKGTGFNRHKLIDAQNASKEDVVGDLARMGANPTRRSARAMREIQAATDAAASKIVRNASRARFTRISAIDLKTEIMDTLRRSHQGSGNADIDQLIIEEALATALRPTAESVSEGLSRKFTTKTIIPEQGSVDLAFVNKYSPASSPGKVRKVGGTPEQTIITDHGISLPMADAMRRDANARSGSLSTDPKAQVYRAVADSLKRHIGEALGSRDRAQWEQLLRQSHRLNIVGHLAHESSRSGVPGVLQGALAFGAGPAVAGLGYGLGGPVGGAAGLTTGLALSQLSPTGRSLLGQQIVGTGTLPLAQNTWRGFRNFDQSAVESEDPPFLNLSPDTRGVPTAGTRLQRLIAPIHEQVMDGASARPDPRSYYGGAALGQMDPLPPASGGEEGINWNFPGGGPFGRPLRGVR
jgi:hypothetical protein